MDIYFRKNTGIITPQKENLDFFIIEEIGKNLKHGYGFINVEFYRTKANAQKMDVPSEASRRIEFEIGSNEDVPNGVAWVLNFENIETTALDKISLSNAELTT